MWHLTVRSPLNVPVEYWVKPGKNTLGRKADNQIVIADESASRLHAEIYCQNDLAIIYDLGSTNGTFVNRELITKPLVLQPGDQIRIGQHVISVAFQATGASPNSGDGRLNTRKLTRELLLESIDRHAVFLDAVASRLTIILDLETALQEIAEMTRLAVGAGKCAVVLAEHFDHLEDSELQSLIIQQTIEQHSIMIIPNLTSQDDRAKGADHQALAPSVLSVPVLIGQEVVALLYAYKTDPTARPFDRHDVQLAVAISHQAALTIQRAKLIEKSQMFEQLAITDSLTGLHNRRHILNLAELEFQRAQRFQHPLTMLVLDLDDLKQINDTYGHLVGDQALQAVAENGKKELREVDSIGRFGGDEFVILLVETELCAGRIVAERICQVISDTLINTRSGPLKISVSIGAAAVSEKASSLADLLDQADKALMMAKKAGKHRVAVAE
jgi:diguanylate cyclase (GGDEF)-like protein